VTGRAGRTPEQIERDRARSRAWHSRQRELAAIAAAVASRPKTSGRRPAEPSGHPRQQRPDTQRLAELERHVVELEAELIALRAYRQKNRDRSHRNAIKRREVKDTGTSIAITGTLDASTGLRAGAATSNSARVTRALATGGTSRVNNSADGGASRARRPAAAPPPGAQPDEAMLLDQLWADTRVLAAIKQRGLNAEWERANFQHKQGGNPRNWTVDYLVAWLLRSTVQVPDPAPVTRAATGRVPCQEPRVPAACAVTAYEHDPWAGRTPPIAEADLVRGSVL